MDWQTRAVDYHQKFANITRLLKYYRCGCCRARRVLNKELWEYTRPSKCYECNSVDWRYDKHRYIEHKTKTGAYSTCHCDGVRHPHRKGSDVWCEHHKSGPTEQDFIDRYN